MDYGRLISRSFQVMWRYRALWVFGVLFALTGGSGGTWSSNSNPALNYEFGRGDFSGTPPGTLPPQFAQLTAVLLQSIGIIVAAVCCILLIWLVLSIILRIISRGALIGLVQELEANGTAPTARHGFDIGADRFRSLLGIALVVNVPLAVVSGLLLLGAAAPALIALLPLIAEAESGRPEQFVGPFIGALFGSIFLLCCIGLLLFAVQLVIRPFYEFIVRVSVISRRGTMDSIREGYQLVRANLGNTILLYLVIIGVGIGFGVLMIPVALLLLGIPAVAIFVAYLINSSNIAIVLVALVVGIPMLLVLLLISGLYQVFEQNLWTEGFLVLTNPSAAPAALRPPPAPTAAEPAAPAP